MTSTWSRNRLWEPPDVSASITIRSNIELISQQLNPDNNQQGSGGLLSFGEFLDSYWRALFILTPGRVAADGSRSRRQCASIFDMVLRASFSASRLVANDSVDRR
jgi:hypothetical protein